MQSTDWKNVTHSGPEIFPLAEPYLIRMVFRAVFDGSRSHGDGLKMLNGVK